MSERRGRGPFGTISMSNRQSQLAGLVSECRGRDAGGVDVRMLRSKPHCVCVRVRATAGARRAQRQKQANSTQVAWSSSSSGNGQSHSPNPGPKSLPQHQATHAYLAPKPFKKISRCYVACHAVCFCALQGRCPNSKVGSPLASGRCPKWSGGPSGADVCCGVRSMQAPASKT